MLILLLALFMLAIIVSGKSVLGINNNVEVPTNLIENVSVSVNCTSAELSVLCTVSSSNTSLVHFPPQVDMNRDELVNAAAIIASFSRFTSGLLFTFDNVDTETAKSLADAVKGSLEEAFDTMFTWNSTEVTEEGCIVTYISSGKDDLPKYLSWLMETCLAPDLGGFTLTFIPVINEENAFIEISAIKEGGGFNWTYSMGVGYFTTMPTGAGPHEIDFLDLLNVESLSPSKYASQNGWFISSMVMLTIVSSENVSYVSSEPDTVNSLIRRGWYINPMTQPPVQLQALFSFADNPTPITELLFTFSGMVIPEFPASILIAALISITLVIIIAKRKFPH